MRRICVDRGRLAQNKYAKNKKGQAPKQKTKDNTKKAKRMKVSAHRTAELTCR